MLAITLTASALVIIGVVVLLWKWRQRRLWEEEMRNDPSIKETNDQLDALLSEMKESRLAFDKSSTASLKKINRDIKVAKKEMARTEAGEIARDALRNLMRCCSSVFRRSDRTFRPRTSKAEQIK